MATDVPGKTSPGWRARLDVVATATMILASCGTIAALSLGYFNAPKVVQTTAKKAEPAVPKDPVSLDGAALRGNKAATVALLEYSDFQCPFCGKFARETLPAFERDYVDTGKVLFAYRNFPLTQIHPFAEKAAEAAVCAGQQGRMWEMHDALFGDQQHLDAASLRSRAATLKLDQKTFDACLAGQATTAVGGQTATASPLGVTGTPTLFIGRIQADGKLKIGRRLSGAQPESALSSAVEELLKSGSK